MGLARYGSTSGNGSGDLFIALSTANPSAAAATGVSQLAMLPNDRMNPLLEAVIQATEEAILNAMFAAETMVGRDERKVDALPVDRVRAILKKIQPAGGIEEPRTDAGQWQTSGVSGPPNS